MDAAKVKIVRDCLIDGVRQPVGATLTLALLTALQVVDAGKASFVDAGDRARALDAQRRDTARMLRTQATAAPGDGPWQPWRPC